MEANFDALYQDARQLAANSLGEEAALPERCPYTLDQVLEDGWYPPSRHGLT